MRYPISKLIWAGLIIALIFLGAMFILPVVGAVLIGVFALSCLIWLSSKVFGFFQGERTYTEDNPGDYYDASARTSIVPKKWNKTQAVDAEVIEVEEIKKEPIHYLSYYSLAFRNISLYLYNTSQKVFRSTA